MKPSQPTPPSPRSNAVTATSAAISKLTAGPREAVRKGRGQRGKTRPRIVQPQWRRMSWEHGQRWRRCQLKKTKAISLAQQGVP